MARFAIDIHDVSLDKIQIEARRSTNNTFWISIEFLGPEYQILTLFFRTEVDFLAMAEKLGVQVKQAASGQVPELTDGE